MKKYSFDDVVEEFAKTDYILLSDESEYVNSGVNNMRYICPRHQDKGELTTSLAHLREGKGCKYCGWEATALAETIELDIDAHKALCEEKGYTYVESTRINGKIHVGFICPEHEVLGTQYQQIDNMKRLNSKCKYCRGRDLPEWYLLEKIKETNPTFVIYEHFNKVNDYVDCECIKHNMRSRKRVGDLINGIGCYYCGIEKLSQQSFLSDDEVQNRINKKNPHIKLLKYKGMETKAHCLCTKHNIEFDKTPYILFDANSGCKKCYAERLRDEMSMGIDEYKRRLSIIHPSIEVIGEYINNSTPIEMYCKEHDYYFSLSPASMLNRLSCCSKSRVTYKEEQMCQLLERWGYNITRQKTFDGCEDIRNLSYDVYLDDFNIAIEFQGEQHYQIVRYSGESDAEAIWRLDYTQYHDQLKKEYCKKKHIRLICVPYWEYEDIEYFLFNELAKRNAIIEI